MLQAIKNLLGIGENSKSAAKSRLHFVLVQDRAGLNSDEIAQFRKELVSVIEKYFVIDENGFDINYKRSSETTTLLINSPIVVRRKNDLKNNKNEKIAEKKEAGKEKTQASTVTANA